MQCQAPLQYDSCLTSLLHACRPTRYGQPSQNMQTTMCSPWTTPGQTNQLCTLELTNWMINDETKDRPTTTKMDVRQHTEPRQAAQQ